LIGTLFGTLLLATLGPALTFLGVEAYWDRALQGLIILVAVAADSISLAAMRQRGRAFA
jgi:rhamnose transport system permease protein